LTGKALPDVPTLDTGAKFLNVVAAGASLRAI